MTLEELKIIFGLSEEELKNTILEMTSEKLKNHILKQNETMDFEGYITNNLTSNIQNTIEKTILEKSKEIIEKLHNDLLDTTLEKTIKNITLKHTNQYGECKKPEETFIEFLTGISKNYLYEKVDLQGNTTSYNHNSSSRLEYLINKGIKTNIRNETDQAVKEMIKGLGEHISNIIRSNVNKIANDLVTKIK